MEVITKKISFNEKLRLIPVSDIHLGAKASNDARFKRLVKWVISKEDTHVIVLGDVVDAIIRQDLRRFSGKSPTQGILRDLDSALNTYRDMAIEALKPLSDNGRLLGVGRGNHEDALMKHHSFDITKDICKALEVPNLGYSFLYRLTLNKSGDKAVRNIVVYGHHGWGSSRKSGGAINKRENLTSNFEADVFIMGHDHHKFGKRHVRLAVTTNGTPKLVHKPMIVAATGSFLRAYAQGETTYAEKMGYAPNDIGTIRIDIDITGSNKELDMHVSE